MAGEERFWVARARWRLRGAMLWPAFVIFTLVDGFVLYRLSPVGFDFDDPIAPVILATFGNLFLIAVVSPLLSKRLAARREAITKVDREVLQDRVGTTLLAVGLVGVIAAGLGNRQVIVSETNATERNARTLDLVIAHAGNAELTRNRETANTHRLSEGYFRTCVARDDRRRAFCFFIDTNKHPAEVRRDPSELPNSRMFPNSTGGR